MARRIVLLSDGTGNSSAKVWRTNVWRMFSALDLTDNNQVAFYDDGVGTSSFKPLAILGGAFGIGLRRNVIALYKFACRNFRAPGDEIFGFGFSRGAFTIRVTIGLILDQGLVPVENISESELDRLAHQAYRTYHRRHFHTNWGLIFRAIRKCFGKDVAPSSTVPSGRNVPVIRFLGLWDTVAAYGLPVDEMTQGVSQWIWPLEIPSHKLDDQVKRACHALSLDDERTTFHPVLWTETNQVTTAQPPQFTHEERISQVWFAGVHANVGGGYPDDSLAHVPLYWIMEEAKACGLTFKQANPNAIAETKEAQDKDGRLYDSRNGFASYYRYGPRRLSLLCNQIFSRTTGDSVSIPRPKIHESVFQRIQNNAHVYSPIGIPHDYSIVSNVPASGGNGATFRIHSLPEAIQPGMTNTYETAGDAQARVVAERGKIWPLVWLRALLYFLTLAVTILFFIYPLTERYNPITAAESRLRWVSDLIQIIGGFLPSWASTWVVGYAGHPVMFLVLGGAIALLMISAAKVAAAINDRMSALWKGSLSHVLPVPVAPPSIKPAGKEAALLALRTTWKDYVGPALSAIAIAFVVLTVSDRLLFTAIDEAGLVCEATPNADLKYIPDKGVLLSLNTSDICFASGYKLGRLERYLVWTNPNLAALTNEYPGYVVGRSTCTAVPPAPLMNGSVVTDARGYSTFHNDTGGSQLTWRQMITHILATPLRRYYFQSWFQPIARYGNIGHEVDFLEPDPDRRVTKISEHVTPKVTDELYFYLNDAVSALPSYQPLYDDNKGCISFFVKTVK